MWKMVIDSPKEGCDEVGALTVSLFLCSRDAVGLAQRWEHFALWISYHQGLCCVTLPSAPTDTWELSYSILDGFACPFS